MESVANQFHIQERKFEVHLTKVGRLSQEELVDFFKKFDSWYVVEWLNLNIISSFYRINSAHTL